MALWLHYVLLCKYISALDQSNGTIGATIKDSAPDDKYQSCTNFVMQDCNGKEVAKEWSFLS